MSCTSRHLEEKNSIVQVLARRELGLVHSVKKYKQLFRKLVLARDFVKVDGPPLVSHGNIKYGAGKVILRNSTTKTMDCYDLANISRDGRVRRIWSVPASPRWEDYEIETTSLPPPHQPPLPNMAHRPRLSVLRANNRLERFCLNTGELKLSLILPSKTRFTEMTFDTDRHWLVLGSTRSSEDVLRSFIILDRQTLQFLYHIEVQKSVIGRDSVDVAICYGTLLVMHSNKVIKFYCLEDILVQRKGRENSSEMLGEMRDKGQSVSGGILPGPNVEMRELPPCLHQIKSHHHHLEIKLNPYVYIRCEAEKKFALHHLADHRLLEGGRIAFKDGVEEEFLTFHPDESHRLIHSGHFGFALLSLVKDGPTCQDIKVEETFHVSSNTEGGGRDLKTDLPKTTRSGRRVTTPPNYLLEDSMHNLTFDYEDELDLLTILFSEDQEQDGALLTHIKLCQIYDNKSMKLLKSLPLDLLSAKSGMSGDVDGGVGVILDNDLLLISVKSSAKSVIHMFRAVEV